MLPPSSGLEVTHLEAAYIYAELVTMMPINWHSAGDISWYNTMIYKFMCLLQTMCFHLGMTSNYIWDYGTPNERVATEEEFDRITMDIHYEFVKDEGKIQYSHKVWCSIGHSYWQDSFIPGLVNAGFVVDKVTLEQVSFQVVKFCHVTIIPYTFSHSMLIHSSPVCLILVTNGAI